METPEQPTGQAGKCGATTRGGAPCGNPAGFKTDHPGIGHCHLHLGCTPTHQRSAEIEMARRECVTLGIPIAIHPADALIEEVFRARGNVEFYEQLVQELPTHPAADVLVPGVEMDDGERIPAHWERGQPGIYGRSYHVSGVPTGEAKPHVLVVLYNQERDRLAAVSAAALKAGVDAALVEIAEQQATLIAEGFRAFAVALGHDPASPEVREAFRAQLTLIAGGRQA